MNSITQDVTVKYLGAIVECGMGWGEVRDYTSYATLASWYKTVLSEVFSAWHSHYCLER